MTTPTSSAPALSRLTTARRPLRCPTCGRVEPREANNLGRLADRAWPECCGRVMRPAAEADRTSAPAVERRAEVRRRARPGARAEVRRGWLGRGPDLAVGLVDVSEGGVRVRLAGPLEPGEQVQMALWAPRGQAPVRGPAVVCWCKPDTGGGMMVGFRLVKRLAPRELAALAG